MVHTQIALKGKKVSLQSVKSKVGRHFDLAYCVAMLMIANC